MKPKSSNQVNKYLGLGLFFLLNISKYITNVSLKLDLTKHHNRGGFLKKITIMNVTF